MDLIDAALRKGSKRTVHPIASSKNPQRSINGATVLSPLSTPQRDEANLGKIGEGGDNCKDGGGTSTAGVGDVDLDNRVGTTVEHSLMQSSEIHANKTTGDGDTGSLPRADGSSGRPVDKTMKRGGDTANSTFDLNAHKQASLRAFLAPLPRRQMTVPAAIRERKALYEKENTKTVSSKYFYQEDELRALTPLRLTSVSGGSRQRKSHQKANASSPSSSVARSVRGQEEEQEGSIPPRPTRGEDEENDDNSDDMDRERAAKEEEEENGLDRSVSSSTVSLLPPPLRRYMSSAVTVTAAELAAIKRLASFDEPVRTEAALPIEIPTSGYQLRWLHNPKKYPRPTNPLNLLTMRTDYLVAGGGHLHCQEEGDMGTDHHEAARTEITHSNSNDWDGLDSEDG